MVRYILLVNCVIIASLVKRTYCPLDPKNTLHWHIKYQTFFKKIPFNTSFATWCPLRVDCRITEQDIFFKVFAGYKNRGLTKIHSNRNWWNVVHMKMSTGCVLRLGIFMRGSVNFTHKRASNAEVNGRFSSSRTSNVENISMFWDLLQNPTRSVAAFISQLDVTYYH